MSSESLWNYHREEIDDDFDDDDSEGRSCKYKTKILGKKKIFKNRRCYSTQINQ